RQTPDHGESRGVRGEAAEHDDVQPRAEKGVVDQGRQRPGRIPPTGRALVEPVARPAARARPPHDVEQLHLTHEPSVHVDDERQQQTVPGSEVRPPAQLPEGHRTTGLPGHRGLPGGEPGVVAPAHRLPRRAVPPLERPQRQEATGGQHRPTADRPAPAHAGRTQSPERPPDLAVTRTSVTVASRSTALTMSMSASAATLTQVSASISTPVRSAVRTVALMSTPSS